VHLLIRGRDAEGRDLRIDHTYLWGGLRQRAREVATGLLGMRTRQEIDAARMGSDRAPLDGTGPCAADQTAGAYGKRPC
jgi:hypothetical protein